MRGAPCLSPGCATGARIIPADAGNTTGESRDCSPARDHPRGCGEHNGDEEHAGCRWGSSPRMRGALIIRRGDEPGVGIIPADAGSTCGPSAWRSPRPDHPRGCGEHCCQGSLSPSHTGSSPRMWGARHVLFEVGPGPGIIPADAGSTSRWPRASGTTADHPRGCGEHSASSWREHG